MHFETVVKQIIPRTLDVKSIRFDRPEDFDCNPGQYMIITIKNETMELRKPFTISSSPTERDFLELTKRLTDHQFSKALESLKIGDKVLVEAPFGEFTFEGEYDKIALLAGGIGITPLRSIIRYATDNQLKTDIILLYSSRFDDDIIFKNELEEMQRVNNNLKVVHTLTQSSENWKGLIGRIDKEMVQKIIPDYVDRVFYICGPSKMVEAMVEILKNLKIPEKQIKHEYFPGY